MEGVSHGRDPEVLGIFCKGLMAPWAVARKWNFWRGRWSRGILDAAPGWVRVTAPDSIFVVATRHCPDVGDGLACPFDPYKTRRLLEQRGRQEGETGRSRTPVTLLLRRSCRRTLWGQWPLSLSLWPPRPSAHQLARPYCDRCVHVHTLSRGNHGAGATRQRWAETPAEIAHGAGDTGCNHSQGFLGLSAGEQRLLFLFPKISTPRRLSKKISGRVKDHDRSVNNDASYRPRKNPAPIKPWSQMPRKVLTFHARPVSLTATKGYP